MRLVITVLAVCAAGAGVRAAGQVFVAAPLLGGAQAEAPLTGPFDGPKPEFEVASVRQNTEPAGDRLSLSSPPGRFMVSGLPLQSLVVLAYQLRNDQIEGIPDWVRTERFDINAKMQDGAPQEHLQWMLQSLLEDRFQLRWHTETREIDVYELVVAREDGQTPKLVPSAVDCGPVLAARQKASTDARARGESPEAIARMLEAQRLEQGGGFPCSTNVSRRPPAGGGAPIMTLTARAAELASLVSLLSSLSGRPVVDKTGLTGGFDFEFSVSSRRGVALGTGFVPAPVSPVGTGAAAGRGASVGSAAPVPAAVFDDGPTVFQAIEEQLGLRLRSARGPGQFFVVDSIERPEPD